MAFPTGKVSTAVAAALLGSALVSVGSASAQQSDRIQGSTRAPAVEQESGSTFQCQDGAKLVLAFANTDAGLAAVVWLHGASYELLNLPPEPGPVRIVWSDGDHSLTWSPGVQLMWMSGDTHLMCGRGGGHKH